MNALFAGAEIASLRLDKAWTLTVAVGVLVLSVLAATALRVDSPEDAADVTLAALFGLGIPLLALGFVARACKSRRLDEAVAFTCRHGASRPVAVLGLVGGTALRVATIAGVAS